MTLSENFQQLAFEKMRFIAEQREEILVAFIAKYHLEPEDVIQIEQHMDDGSIRWHVEKRIKK